MNKKFWIPIVAIVIIAAVLLGFKSAYTNDNSIPYTQAPKHVGQQVTVRGKIVSTTYRDGTDFLDYCADYTNCPLALVVLDKNTSKFGDVGKYSGNNVRVTGTVSTYQGRTEIILTNPSQIKLE
jgi:hypothetical protein